MSQCGRAADRAVMQFGREMRKTSGGDQLRARKAHILWRQKMGEIALHDIADHRRRVAARNRKL